MKLNQFALYRVDQQTEGEVLWHLPYQEAIQQNVSITVENYRLISIHEMQENEKVADIWKRMKQQCEVSDVLVLNQNGEISCYYVDENYPQYLAGFIRINTSGALITMETENYQIDGKKGNWIATDTIIIDVLLVFPTNHKKNSTVRILKTPKTESSVRKIFLPKSVANMLADWKAEQDEMKEILGDEYMDYNLVMASTFGLPLGDGAIRGPLKKLIEDYNLPPVVFHSFRHSSVTYKLKLNGGDIKAVQGDSGHAQVNMVTDVYSHILDDDRRKNAELFEEAFYEKKNLDPQMHVQQENNNATVADEVDPELLAKVLANPEMRALLNSLVKTMK